VVALVRPSVSAFDASFATQKSLAGSVLAQSGTGKKTSAGVAKEASKALTEGRTSATTKELAGGALSQKP
jgi:hypothetical protein